MPPTQALIGRPFGGTLSCVFESRRIFSSQSRRRCVEKFGEKRDRDRTRVRGSDRGAIHRSWFHCAFNSRRFTDIEGGSATSPPSESRALSSSFIVACVGPALRRTLNPRRSSHGDRVRPPLRFRGFAARRQVRIPPGSPLKSQESPRLLALLRAESQTPETPRNSHNRPT